MKLTPLFLVPLALLSCQGPLPGPVHSSDSTAANTQKDSIPIASHDSPGKAVIDTLSAPMVAKNWIGHWKSDDMFHGGELHITDIRKGKFSFSIYVSDGGGSGELEGSATLQGYQALFTKKEYGGACRIEFSFQGDSISVDQMEGNCDAGAGVYYSGIYYKHPPKRPAETLVSLEVLKTDREDKKFRELVGDDYKLFVQSSQMVFQDEKDMDSLHAVVHQAGVKHEFNSKQNIILVNDHLDIWAAVINEDSVNYYTNRPDYKHRLPKTIENWRENFSEKPIVFK